MNKNKKRTIKLLKHKRTSHDKHIFGIVLILIAVFIVLSFVLNNYSRTQEEKGFLSTLNSINPFSALMNLLLEKKIYGPTEKYGCTPDCSGKECGSDGCDGSCGTCLSEQTCSDSGKCIDNDCVPKTCTEQGFSCGTHDNTCGNSINCGTCAPGDGGGGNTGGGNTGGTGGTPPSNTIQNAGTCEGLLDPTGCFDDSDCTQLLGGPAICSAGKCFDNECSIIKPLGDSQCIEQFQQNPPICRKLSLGTAACGDDPIGLTSKCEFSENPVCSEDRCCKYPYACDDFGHCMKRDEIEYKTETGEKKKCDSCPNCQTPGTNVGADKTKPYTVTVSKEQGVDADDVSADIVEGVDYSTIEEVPNDDVIQMFSVNPSNANNNEPKVQLKILKSYEVSLNNNGLTQTGTVPVTVKIKSGNKERLIRIHFQSVSSWLSAPAYDPFGSSSGNTNTDPNQGSLFSAKAGGDYITNQQEYDKVMSDSENMPVIIMFTADWCIPCRNFKRDILPGLIRNNPNIKIVFVNIDSNPELAGLFGVRGVPTFFTICNKQKKATSVGFSPDIITSANKCSFKPPIPPKPPEPPCENNPPATDNVCPVPEPNIPLPGPEPEPIKPPITPECVPIPRPGNTPGSACDCKPKTIEQLKAEGKQCGKVDDGCGKLIDLGDNCGECKRCGKKPVTNKRSKPVRDTSRPHGPDNPTVITYDITAESGSSNIAIELPQIAQGLRMTLKLNSNNEKVIINNPDINGQGGQITTISLTIKDIKEDETIEISGTIEQEKWDGTKWVKIGKEFIKIVINIKVDDSKKNKCTNDDGKKCDFPAKPEKDDGICKDGECVDNPEAQCPCPDPATGGDCAGAVKDKCGEKPPVITDASQCRGTTGRVRVPNFIVESNDGCANEYALVLVYYRCKMAVELTGDIYPNWSQPVIVTIQSGPGLGCGGANSFVYDQGEVFGWRMNIQGNIGCLINDVIPHEVSHSILATYFRQPVPRWFDEGLSTTEETCKEQNKYKEALIRYLTTGKGIAFCKLLLMKDYPEDDGELGFTLYAHGNSLVTYLKQLCGNDNCASKKKLVMFVGTVMRKEKDWNTAINEYFGANGKCGNYGITNTKQLQDKWLKWVMEGCPKLTCNPVLGTGTNPPRGTQAF